MYKFHVEIKAAKGKAKGQFYAVIVARNGRLTFDGETRKNKAGLKKTINNLFPGVKIIDKTIPIVQHYPYASEY